MLFVVRCMICTYVCLVGGEGIGWVGVEDNDRHRFPSFPGNDEALVNKATKQDANTKTTLYQLTN